MKPGTELKRLLHRFGIRATANCRCNRYTELMDHKGCSWCLQNIELLIDVMKIEAEKRGLPFLRCLGRGLVRRAVRTARSIT